MKKIEFNDLVNSIIEEAPITKYLTPAVKYKQRLRKAAGRAGTAVSNVGRTAVNIAKKVPGIVGSVAGAAAAALEAPGKVVKGAHKAVFEPGGAAKMLRSAQQSLSSKATGEKDIMRFDKNIVKTMIANQLSDITVKSQKQDTTGGTSTASTQVQGQATGGTASPAAADGTSTSTTTTPTSMMKPAAAAIQREPKTGDVFNVYGDYGRITRYKVTKVHPDHVEVKKV